MILGAMELRPIILNILRLRVLILIAVATLTAVAFVFALRVGFDSSIDIWFLEDDPNLIVYRDFLERFGADEMAVVGIFADDVFTPKTLAVIDRVTRAAQKVPHAHRVRSISNTSVPVGSEGMIDFGPLFRKIPTTQAEAQLIRAKAMASPILAGNLFAKDGKAAAVIVELSQDGQDFLGKVAMSEALHAIAAQEETPGIKIHMAGTPIFDDAFYRYSKRDAMIYVPATFLCVLIIIFIVFRRLSAVMICMGVVFIASVWTFAIMGAMGLMMNVVSIALLALTLAVGVANVVHILADYYQEARENSDAESAMEISLERLLTPCFFTSMTTAMGLLSLSISDLKPVREFGWLAALSVSFAFILSFTFVPAVLRYAKLPSKRFVEKQKHGLMSKTLNLLCRPSRRGSLIVIIISAALIIPAIYGLMIIKVGSNPMTYFKKDDPVSKEMIIVDDALGGSVSMESLIFTRAGGLKEPEILQRIDDLERYAETFEGATQSLSIVDVLKDMNRIMFDGDPAQYLVPATRPTAAQYYLLMEGDEDFDAYVQEDFSVGRISTRVQLLEAEKLMANVKEFFDTVEREYNDEDIQVTVTGFIKLMFDMERYLISSQVKSFTAAFVVISLMMIILLRSVKLGLFALIPNLLPIFTGMAFMGFLNINLDPGTVMIGSIALGLVVDDTVHFLVRFKRFSHDGADIETGIRKTIDEAGRPIIVTSICLAAGFAVLTFGSFTPNINFGVISAIVILLALACDLVVLPAALILVRPKVGK